MDILDHNYTTTSETVYQQMFDDFLQKVLPGKGYNSSTDKRLRLSDNNRSVYQILS